MIDTMMLLVALLAFATLVVGWMVLPDAPQVEHATAATPVAEPA